VNPTAQVVVVTIHYRPTRVRNPEIAPWTFPEAPDTVQMNLLCRLRRQSTTFKEKNMPGRGKSGIRANPAVLGARRL